MRLALLAIFLLGSVNLASVRACPNLNDDKSEAALKKFLDSLGLLPPAQRIKEIDKRIEALEKRMDILDDEINRVAKNYPLPTGFDFETDNVRTEANRVKANKALTPEQKRDFRTKFLKQTTDMGKQLQQRKREMENENPELHNQMEEVRRLFMSKLKLETQRQQAEKAIKESAPRTDD